MVAPDSISNARAYVLPSSWKSVNYRSVSTVCRNVIYRYAL